MKNIKTFLLLFFLSLFFMIIGNLIAGRSGMLFALAFSLITNFISYWYSDKIILKMYNAKEVDQSHDLYKIVSKLVSKADLPMPKVYIIEQNQANAFATGRNPENAAVACTVGLLNTLDINELSGVIGHELAHINNRDILIGTVAASIAGAIAYLANIARWSAFLGTNRRSSREENNNTFILILTAIFAPLAAGIIQMSISRTREYKADELGAKYCGNPLYLANALKKLELGAYRNKMKATEATSHMFIINPFTGLKNINLFSTHPSTQDRILRLEKMAKVQYDY